MPLGETPSPAETVDNPDLPVFIWPFTYEEIACFYAAREEGGLQARVQVGFSPINPQTATGLAELIRLARQKERKRDPTGRNRVETVDPSAEALLARRYTHGVLALSGDFRRIDEIWSKAETYMGREASIGRLP
jgi:hypothetical protein